MLPEFTLALLGLAGAALERGLAAVEPQKIQADLYFLADDALAGRDTPSPEQRVAARYLAARMARLGLEPAGEDRTYFDRFDLGFARIDAERSSLAMLENGDERALVFGSDYYAATAADAFDVAAEGELIYVGEGRAEDYAALDPEAPRGRWVLCRDVGRRAIQRRNEARERGAIGVLVTPGDDYELEPYEERFAKTTELLLKGRLARGPGAEAEPAPGDAGKLRFPQVYVAPHIGRAWLANQKLGDVQTFRVRETRVAHSSVTVENVCALWPGSDPERRDEVLIVSAHYDHVGTRGGEIYNGADDNGSGTTGLLALAEALVAYGPLERSVLLIWVSGEEKGLFGSEAWSKAPTLAPDLKPVCNVNIDMIGRNAPDKLGLTPSEAHPMANRLAGVARELAPLEGFPELESADDFYHRSDQLNFAKLGIPVCFFFAGVHEDYHRPGDDADKIDYDKVARVARLVLRLLVRLEDEELP